MYFFVCRNSTVFTHHIGPELWDLFTFSPEWTGTYSVALSINIPETSGKNFIKHCQPGYHFHITKLTPTKKNTVGSLLIRVCTMSLCYIYVLGEKRGLIDQNERNRGWRGTIIPNNEKRCGNLKLTVNWHGQLIAVQCSPQSIPALPREYERSMIM